MYAKITIFLVLIYLLKSCCASKSKPSLLNNDDYTYDDDDDSLLLINKNKESGGNEKMVTFNTMELQKDMILPNLPINKLLNYNGHTILINGTDLFYLDVNPKMSRFRYFGHLENINSDKNIIDIQAVEWKGYTLLILVLTNRYKVYFGKNSNNNGQMKLIETIAAHGQHQKVLLFNRENDGVYCVIGNTILNGYMGSTIRLYKWRGAHFSLIFTKNTKYFHDLLICDNAIDILLLAIPNDLNLLRNQNGVMVDIFRLKNQDLKLIQNIYLNAQTIYMYKMNGQCFILAVSVVKTLSTSLSWQNNRFNKINDYPGLLVDNFATDGKEMIFLQFNTELMVFTNTDFKRKYSFDLMPIIKSMKQEQIVLIKLLFILKETNLMYLGLVFRFGQNNQLRFHFVQIILESVTINDVLTSAEPLQLDKCYWDLEQATQKQKIYVERFQKKFSNLMRTDKKTNFPGTIETPKLVISKRGKFNRLNLINTNKDSANNQILQSPKEILKQFEKIRLKIEQIQLKNRRLIRQTELADEKNDNLQIFDTINVKNLRLSNDLFKNVLTRKSKNINFTGQIITNQLNVTNQIELIHDSNNETTNLSSDNMENQRAAIIETTSIKNIKNLLVKTINGINWNDFYAILYRKDYPQIINGNLLFKKPISITTISAPTINKINIDNFFTITTDQIIESSIKVNQFLAIDVETNKINDNMFGSNVATFGADNLIESSVKCLTCTIDRLHLSDNEEHQSFARHVVGTKLEDLSQIYTGNVRIKGSLKLNNIILGRPKTKVFVGDREFHTNIHDYYWMKNVDQKFDTIKFKIPNTKNTIKTPQIFTKSINNNPAENYLLITENPKIPKLSYIFDMATVYGNIITNPDTINKLSQINNECIRRNSAAHIHSGRKSFMGTITVNEFNTDTNLYELKNVENLLKKKLLNKNELIFNCIKQFDTLTVSGDIEIQSDLNIIEIINGVNMNNLFQNIIRIDRVTSLEKIKFNNNLMAINSSIEFINNEKLINILNEFEYRFNLDNGQIKRVIINGTAKFNGDLYINQINGIIFDEYLSKMVTAQSTNVVEIFGEKRFLNGLFIQNLKTNYLNKIDVNNWLTNAIHKTKEQTVTGSWDIINYGTANQLEVNEINGVTLNQLIDLSIKNNSIEIMSDIFIDGTVEVYGNIYSNRIDNCDIKILVETISNGPNKRNWKYLEIHGNTKWPIDQNDYQLNYINKLLEYGVTKNTQQVILHETTFNNVIKINNLESTTYFINNINLIELFNDALKNDEQYQVISGRKTFINTIHIGTVVAINNKPIMCPIINGVNILELNQTLYRLYNAKPITGIKTFAYPPTIGELIITGTINGILTSDIATTATMKPLPPIAFFDKIYIDDMLIIHNTINQLSFQYFLNNRIRLDGEPQEITGFINFKDLILKGKLTKLSQINDIFIDDIVVQISQVPQEITAPKYINGNLTIDGPSMFVNINDVDIVLAYTNSILLDTQLPVEINQMILFDTLEIKQSGLNIEQLINGINIKSLNYWTPPKPTDLQPIYKQISDTVSMGHLKFSNINSVKPKKILYLEHANDIRFIYDFHPNYPVTFIVDTLVNCDQCICPAQYDISLTSNHQIYVHQRKNYERKLRLQGKLCNGTILTQFQQHNDCFHYSKEWITTQSPSTGLNKENTIFKWNCINSFDANNNSIDENKTIILSNDLILDAKLFEYGEISLLLVNHQNGTVTIFRLYNNKIILINYLYGTAHYRLDVINWSNNNYQNILMVFSKPITSDSIHGQVHLYYYDGANFQTIFNIPGDFDISQWIWMPKMGNELMIWLGNRNSDGITIIKTISTNGALEKFIFFQKIYMPYIVKSIKSIEINEFNYMAVVTQNNYLYLYEYNYLEGWITKTYGYFKDIETVLPFLYYDRLYMLISMKTSVAALVVNHQGG